MLRQQPEAAPSTSRTEFTTANIPAHVVDPVVRGGWVWCSGKKSGKKFPATDPSPDTEPFTLLGKSQAPTASRELSRFNGKYAAPIPTDSIFATQDKSLDSGRYAVVIDSESKTGRYIRKMMDLRESLGNAQPPND